MQIWHFCCLFYRFYPSAAKAIATKIVSDELNGVVYDEKDAEAWSADISDKIREAVVGKIINYHDDFSTHYSSLFIIFLLLFFNVFFREFGKESTI